MASHALIAAGPLLAAISYEPLVRIRLGPLAISPHGILTAIGFLVGARLLLRETRRLRVPDETMVSVLTRAGVGALIGARVVFVANHFSSFDSPLEWIQVWEGGISLLGGIAGALIAALPAVRRARLPFFGLMDLAAPWLVLGIAVGRVGDLIIADHLGDPTNLPFGFRCPDIVDVGRTVGSRCPPGEVVHLTAAYDLIVALVVFAVLVVGRRRPAPVGRQTLLLALLYGAGRFGFDFFRDDLRRLGLTGSQWTALALVAVAAVLLARRRPLGRSLAATVIPAPAEDRETDALPSPSNH